MGHWDYRHRCLVSTVEDKGWAEETKEDASPKQTVTVWGRKRAK
jgi:hypothetical protein